VSYTYSGFGDRVKRTQGSAVTWSVYDGDDLLLEADGSGNVLREYTMYPGVDAPHSVRVWSGATAGAANFYMMEQPGHVAGVVNGSSQVVDQYRYTPWGQAESTTETVAQPLRFMAREYDATTGLYYVRARWYDPALARFNSEDPIGLDGGINQYAYVGNSATNLRDPSGLDPYCYVANKATVTVGPGTANGEYWTGAVITDSGPYIKCVETSGSSPSPSTRGSNWDRGGGAPGSTDPMFVDIERRHQQGAQCLIKVGLAALNVVGDVFAVGGILKAVAGAERAAPALGRALAYSLYRGDFAAAVKPGLFPVSTNVGGATAFGVAGMNGKDLLLFGLGFVPIVGSGLSIYDAYETCSGHAK
jgi:RHS repeat-associated protein